MPANLQHKKPPSKAPWAPQGRLARSADIPVRSNGLSGERATYRPRLAFGSCCGQECPRPAKQVPTGSVRESLELVATDVRWLIPLNTSDYPNAPETSATPFLNFPRYGPVVTAPARGKTTAARSGQWHW